MNASNCLANIDIKSFKCQVSCKGSYALIEFVEEKEDKEELAPIMAAYREFQNLSGRSLQFDATSENLSICFRKKNILLLTLSFQ